jgi:hypothetical protein
MAFKGTNKGRRVTIRDRRNRRKRAPRRANPYKYKGNMVAKRAPLVETKKKIQLVVSSSASIIM